MDDFVGDEITIIDYGTSVIIRDKLDGECVAIVTVADAQEIIVRLGEMIIALEKQNESN